MIRNVLILLAHDLAVAWKNKTFLLLLGIPLFVYATLALVDSPATRQVPVSVALLQTESYTPAFLHGIQGAPDLFNVRWVSNEAEAIGQLEKRDVAGFFSRDEGEGAQFRLTVVQRASAETLAILMGMSTLQIAAEAKSPDWISAVRSLQTGSINRQTMPTWILMMVLLVGFIVLPAQVAEEKEKQLFLGWMQTPVRELDWLVSKLAYGIVSMLTAVAALQVLGGELACSHGWGYLAMLCIGGFCFGSLGIGLGLLCRNQASARTLGVLCYLPLLLPAALSDMSRELRNIAPFVPSYYFHEPVRAMLLDGRGIGSFTFSWLSLLVIGLLACLVSVRLTRKRWLM